MEDQLIASSYLVNQGIDEDNCNDGFIDVSHNVDAATNEGGTGEGSSCTSSSLSIYQKYPNLPSDLREILELQNFRIQNMQAEVNTLKEQNAEHARALEVQAEIKNQL